MRPLSLVAATDGNHGRAARVARLLGLGAKIFVPVDMAPARRKSIAEEGAEVIVVDGTYDEAVERSATEEGEHAPGLGHVLAWLRAYTFLGDRSYSTMLWEIDDALKRRTKEDPTSWSRSRRRRLRRRRGPSLSPSRSFAASEAHERRAGQRGLSARVGRCRTHRVRARAARFHHVGSKLRQDLAGRLADRIQDHRPPRCRRRRTSTRGHAPGGRIGHRVRRDRSGRTRRSTGDPHRERRAGRLASTGRPVSCSSTARAPPTPMPTEG